LWSRKTNLKKKKQPEIYLFIWGGLLLCVAEGEKKRYPNIETTEKKECTYVGLFSCKMDKEFIKNKNKNFLYMKVVVRVPHPPEFFFTFGTRKSTNPKAKGTNTKR